MTWIHLATFFFFFFSFRKVVIVYELPAFFAYRQRSRKLSSLISGRKGVQIGKLVPFKSIPPKELGVSILYGSGDKNDGSEAAHEVLRRRVCITKVSSGSLEKLVC